LQALAKGLLGIASIRAASIPGLYTLRTLVDPDQLIMSH
jgi:hypothetical protein